MINEKSNIVKLTYREHYICHWLLTKIYPSKEMTLAFWLFHSLNKNKGYMNSVAYEDAREKWCKLNGEIHKTITEKHRLLLIENVKRGKDHPMYGRHHTEESKEKNRQSHLGCKLSESTKKKISEKSKGNQYFLGHKHSDESKLKTSLSEKALHLHWFTNGIKNIKTTVCPNGYWSGRTISNEHKKGTHWWTDGKTNICSIDCPAPEFIRGRTL